MQFAVRYRRALVVLTTLLLIGPFAPLASSTPASAAGADYFPETGHTLSGPIRTAWQAGGGVWMFGYPISEPLRWSTEAGHTVIAQYFERARLEYHPEYEGTQYRVLGGLLGSDLTRNRLDEPGFLPVQALESAGCRYHPETGHNLCSHFLQWWDKEGGLPIFGHPISEPFTENGYEVQYFERARFEWHPENAGTEWEVALGHLGKIDATRRGLIDASPFATISAAGVRTRVETALRTDASGGETVAVIPAGTEIAVVGGPSWDAYRVYTNGQAGWVRAGDLTWSVAPDPRTATVASLADADPALDALSAEISPLVSIAIYDPLTNTSYEGGTGGPIAAASLAKALLLTIALKQAEQRGDAGPAVGMGTLEVMIEMSDNDAANDVWNSIGLDAGANAFLQEQQLTGFNLPHQFDWGAITANAGDWARFFALLGSGQLLNPSNTALALSLMHDVIGDHRFGVLTPGSDRLSIGKNGWYDDFETDGAWRVNSAGLVDSSEGPPGIAPLSVVMLSRAPGEYGMDWGVGIGVEVQAAAIRFAAKRWDQYYAAVEPPALATLTAQGGSVTSLSAVAAGVSHTLAVWGR